MKAFVRIAVFACYTVGFTACYAGESTGDYGKKVKFAKGKVLTFPDFTLEYLGTHRESSPQYPRGFLFYDFNAKGEHFGVKFSWTSGTGEIAPAGFGYGSHHFNLELKRSDKLGPLKENELVVWRTSP